jgi:hypothetical protein
LSDIYLTLTSEDLGLRIQLRAIWLISCLLRVVQVALASTGRATLLSVQTVLRRVLIDRIIGRELYARTLC